MNITNLFNIVLKASVFGSVVGIIIYTLKSTILRKLSARWQYWLWSIMIIKLIFPSGPESKISIFNKINLTQAISETDILKIAKKAELVSKPQYSGFDIVSYIWFAGFLIALIWTITSFAIMTYKTRKSSDTASDNTMRILDNCRKITGVRRNIKAIVQNHIPTPSLCGIIFPKILITKDFEASSKTHIEHTFIHELSHYKRGDVLINNLILLLQCIHWFNPISWFLFAKLRRDTELATDEKTMLYINPNERKGYGMTLINTIAESTGRPPVILGMARGKKDIKKRIKAISKFKKPGFIQHITGFMTAVFIASVSLTSAVIAKPISNIIFDNIPKFDSVIPQADYYKHNNNDNFIPQETEQINISNEFVTEKSTDDTNSNSDTQSELTEAEIPENQDDPPNMQNTPQESSSKDVIPSNNTDTYGYNSPASSYIEHIIKRTGQTLYDGDGVADMNKYAKLIGYNSDSTGAQSFVIKPNSSGNILISAADDCGYEYEFTIDISNTETPGYGWTYKVPTGEKSTPYYIDGLNPEDEYIVEINTYCPGFYGIDGLILIY